MLKQMREGAKSTVLKLLLFGLLMLAMLGLAVLDVQGMFRGGVGNGVIASYDGEKLTVPAFDRLVQNTLRQQKIKQNDAYRLGLPRQVLNQEIESRLFSLAAAHQGLRIDDALVAQQVKEIIDPLVKKGVPEKQALARLLQTYDLSEKELVSSLKSDMATRTLLQAMAAGIHPPQQLVKDALRYRHEWRRGEYIRLTAADAGAAKTPDEAELKGYYDTVAREYALPEYRTLSVIVLDKKSLGSDVKIPEDRLKQYYNDNIANYQSPGTREISQVVAPDEAAAKEIYAAAEKTGNLQAAAKDKGNYIKPGTFTEASMPVELAKAAFSGAPGKVLPPVQSPLGWHVLLIGKVTPGTTKSFDSVKAEIEKDLAQEKMSEALYERANQIDDEIAGGKNLSEVAKENKIEETVLEKIDARGLDRSGQTQAAALPVRDKVIENGFRLAKGAASPLIETPDGAFIIVGVREIFPAEQQPFEKVRADVLARWQSSRRASALSDKAVKLMERLKLGESFGKIAAELGQTAQATPLIQRGSSPAKAGVDGSMLSALFSLDREGQVTTVSSDNAVILLRLAERKVSPLKEIAKEDTDAIGAILERSLKQDILGQYRQHLIARYKVRVNDKLLGEMYAPKENAEAEGEE